MDDVVTESPCPTRSEQVLARARRFVSPSTRIAFAPLVVDRAHGFEITDVDGRRFLDFHSMACVMNTGYGHPRVVDAVVSQVRSMIHANTAYVVHEPMVELAERLDRLSSQPGTSRVAFGLAGSDAIDGAIKLVRAATGRRAVLSFRRAYHGNTYGALSLSTASMAMRRGFGPLLPDTHQVTFPDVYRGSPNGDGADVARRCLEELDQLVATVVDPSEIAAVFVEPIQGDAGIIVPPAGFMRSLGEFCRRHGIVVVADEIQTGVARTGAFLASPIVELQPDVVVLGKALGSGVPISAIVAPADMMDAWAAPGHVFSGACSPTACAAALATLDVVHVEQLGTQATSAGAVLRRGLHDLQQRHEIIGDVRGAGLMLGLDIVVDRHSKRPDPLMAAKLVHGAFERGVFLTFLAGSVLRLAPPLIIDEAAVARSIEVLDEAIVDAVTGRVPDSAVAALTGW